MNDEQRAALDIERIEREAYERGYVDGYEEHRRSVVWALRQDDTIESIADFLQSNTKELTMTVRLNNDEAMDTAGDLLFALVTAIGLEKKNR